MKERTSIIIKLLITHLLIMPLVLLIAITFNKDNYLLLLIAQTILAVLFFAGYWEFFGLKFKWVYCMLFETMIFLALGAKFNLISALTPNIFILYLLGFVELYLIFLLVKIVIVIHKNDREKLEINFPYKNGNFMVTDGGNSKISRLMNYHYHASVHKQKNTHRSMLYATDIVKLNNKGRKFIPTENEAYPIFGEKIYCPMKGNVVTVVEDIEDNLPFCGNYPYNTGNTVVIKKDNYYLVLAHLKNGSIKVTPGDEVNIGDILGATGNSGMSERPHLHMQLIKSDTDDYWKGIGIGLQYRGRNLYKNRSVKI